VKSIVILCKDAAARFGVPLIDALNRLVVTVASMVSERWRTQRDPSIIAAVQVPTAQCWFQCVVRNTDVIDGFLMVFDSAVAPVGGAWPIAIVAVPAGKSSGLGGCPVTITQGLWVAPNRNGVDYHPEVIPPALDVTTWWSATP
jgi:hypothetical protein